VSDFYGTRIFIEAEIDGDKSYALKSLGDILEGLIEREDVISCGGEVGPEGILEQAATNDGEDQPPTIGSGS